MTFVFGSGFTLNGNSNWADFYKNDPSATGNKNLYCQYKPAGSKAGTINWIAFDATDYSLRLHYNEGVDNLNPQPIQIVIANENGINSEQMGGTYNIVFLYNYNMKEICPSNIYLYYFDAYNDGSYYTVQVVSSPGDLPNASEYVGPITYTRGTPITDDYERGEDTITPDGDIQHADGTQSAGDGSDQSTGQTFDDIGYKDMDCYGLLGMPDNPDHPAYWLQLALQVIRYAGIAALVIMCTIDFIQAITKQDSDALKAAINKSVRRFIFAVILFFVPLIVSTIMDLFGVYGTCTL